MSDALAPEYETTARAVVEPQLEPGERIVAALGWALTRSRVLPSAGSPGQAGVELEYRLHGVKRPNVPVVVTNRRVFVLATTRPPTMLPHRVLAALPRRAVRVRALRLRSGPWFRLRRGHELDLEVEGSPLRLSIPRRADTASLDAITTSLRAGR